MKYNDFVLKLRKFQALKISWKGHEVDILLNEGFVYVESVPIVQLQVFHNLPDALDQWFFPECRTPLETIVDEVRDKDVTGNPTFRKIAFLDPKLLVEPTVLQRNSKTGGILLPEVSSDFELICIEESLSSCLYDVSFETRIYQTLDFRWLRIMLNKNQMLLKPLPSFHDEWENFMFRKYEWEGTKDEWLTDQLAPLAKECFCSSWSVCEESDGIWNNNIRGNISENKFSEFEKSIDCKKVKIQTTVGELLASLTLEKLFDMKNIWKCFRAGHVKYFDEFILRDFKEKAFKLFSDPCDPRWQYYFPHFIMQSLFMKRKPFDYEQEVRLVLLNLPKTESLNTTDSGVFLATEPRRWIHEVVVHPDCSEEDYLSMADQLTALGISRVVLSPLSRLDNDRKPR